MQELVGYAGMAFIIIAWFPSLVETIRTRKPSLGLGFIVLYFFGSVFLAYYALLLNSVPFLVLNLLAAFMPLVQLYYHLKR